MPSIRIATPDDALAVAAVHIRSWQAAYHGIFSEDFLDSLSVERRARRYAFGSTDPRAPRTALAVEPAEGVPTEGVPTEGVPTEGEPERILGFATTGPSRDEDVPLAAELYALYVDPPHWGRGVGRRLMSAVYAHFGCLQASEAILWVLVGNAPAARFYSADGWQPDGSRRDEDVWEVPATVVRYRRSLPWPSPHTAQRAPCA
ncbi:MAG: GNAT family N-acetyltransferase [Solirubrobacteraceae bacterium]